MSFHNPDSYGVRCVNITLEVILGTQPNVIWRVMYHKSSSYVASSASCGLRTHMTYISPYFTILGELIDSCPFFDGYYSKILFLHLCFGLPLLLFPSSIPSKHSLDRPVVERLTWPKSLRVLLFILSKRGGRDVIWRRVDIFVLSIRRCPVMKRIMWFWNTSIRLDSCLVHVMQSKPYKTTGRTYTRYTLTLTVIGTRFDFNKVVFLQSGPTQSNSMF